MLSEAKITKIYCLVDDFCREFARRNFTSNPIVCVMRKTHWWESGLNLVLWLFFQRVKNKDIFKNPPKYFLKNLTELF